MDYKILVMNFGSTSTKLAYYVNDRCEDSVNLRHDPEVIRQYTDYNQQYDLRKQAILDYLDGKGIALSDLDAIAPTKSTRPWWRRRSPESTDIMYAISVPGSPTI